MDTRHLTGFIAAICMLAATALPAAAMELCVKIHKKSGEAKGGVPIILREACRTKKNGTPVEVSLGSTEDLAAIATNAARIETLENAGNEAGGLILVDADSNRLGTVVAARFLNGSGNDWRSGYAIVGRTGAEIPVILPFRGYGTGPDYAVTPDADRAANRRRVYFESADCTGNAWQSDRSSYYPVAPFRDLGFVWATAWESGEGEIHLVVPETSPTASSAAVQVASTLNFSGSGPRPARLTARRSRATPFPLMS